MPFPAGPASTDARLAALRRIAEGEVSPADDDAAVNLSSLGHAEYDGQEWAITPSGHGVLEQLQPGVAPGHCQRSIIRADQLNAPLP